MKADLKVRLYVKIRLYGVGPVRQDGWKPPATCKVQVADGRACLAIASANRGLPRRSLGEGGRLGPRR